MWIAGFASYGVGGAGAYWLPEWVRTSDFFLNLGHAFFPLGVYGVVAGRLRERNKPED